MAASGEYCPTISPKIGCPGRGSHRRGSSFMPPPSAVAAPLLLFVVVLFQVTAYAFIPQRPPLSISYINGAGGALAYPPLLSGGRQRPRGADGVVLLGGFRRFAGGKDGQGKKAPTGPAEHNTRKTASQTAKKAPPPPPSVVRQHQKKANPQSGDDGEEEEQEEEGRVVASMSPPYFPPEGDMSEEVTRVLLREGEQPGEPSIADEEEKKKKGRLTPIPQHKSGRMAAATTGRRSSSSMAKEQEAEESSLLSVRGVMEWFRGLRDDQKRTLFKVMLACVAVLYGTNFGAIKYLDSVDVDVSLVTSGRFMLASAALMPFLWGQNEGLLKAGFEVGAWVSLGYICQAIGLETTKASTSAFICSLSVVVVPLINGILYGRKIPVTTWVACIMAITGVSLLTLQGVGGPVVGDLWSLGQPIGFGMAFVRTEQYMTQHKDKALAMTAAQMTAVAMCSIVWAALTVTAKNAGISALLDPVHLGAMAYTGLITSALAVIVESVALSYVPVEETTVILTTEPVWAAIFGALVLGEQLNQWGMVGAGIIIAGCIMTQLKLNTPIVEEEEEEGGHKGER